MPDILGEEIVRIRSDTTGFESQTKGSILGAATRIAALVGGVFAAVKVFDFAKSAVEEAAQTQKATENIKAQFGAASKSVLAFGDNAASGFAISKSASEQFASQLGLVTQGMGVSQATSAQMTIGLEKLAGSISLIKGTNPSDVFNTLTTSLQGSTRGLKSLGITITSTQEQNKAFQLGLIKTRTDALTPGEKAQAIYALATKNLGGFIQQAGAHSNDLIDTQARLRAEWANMKDEVGAALLPVIERLSGAFATVLPHAFNIAGQAIQVVVTAISQFTNVFALVSEIGDLVRTFINMAQAGRSAGDILSTLGQRILVDLGVSAQNAQLVISKIGQVFGTIVGVVRAAFAPVITVIRSLGAFVSSVFGSVITDVKGLANQFILLRGAGFSLSTSLEAVGRLLLVDVGVPAATARRVISEFAAALATVRDAVAAWIDRLAGTVAPVIALNANVGTLRGALDAVRGAFESFLGLLVAHREIVIAVAAGFAVVTVAIFGVAAAMVVGTAVSTAFGAALAFAFAPVTIIVVTIGLLVAALIYLYRNNERVRDIILSAWETIRVDVTFALTLIEAVVRAFITVALKLWSVFGGFIVENIRVTWSLVKGIVTVALKLIADVILVALALMRGDWGAAWGAMKQIVSDAIGGVVALMRGMGGLILKAIQAIPGLLGNLGHLLFDAGRAIIQGLINGIESMAGAVVSKVKSIASSAVGAVTGALGIGSPSKVFHDQVGVPIVQGIIAGLTTATPDLLAAATLLAQHTTAAAAVGGSLGGVSGRVTARQAPVGASPLNPLVATPALAGVHVETLVVPTPHPEDVVANILNAAAEATR